MEISQLDWQTTKDTLLERNLHMFNNSLMSDIRFLVGRDADSIKSFPAHKYILGISSPVLYAMFYGDLAEEEDVVKVPDSDSEDFLEFLRFLYTDEVNLSTGNVQGVLYLAEKYIVSSLSRKCVEFIEEELKPDYVLKALPIALLHDKKELYETCWLFVENNTAEVLKCESFPHASYEIVKGIVSRDKLNIQECDLFQAVDDWATKQCERKGLNVDRKLKREVLCDLMYCIHYPSMSLQDFVTHVLKSELLDVAELSADSTVFSTEAETAVTSLTKFRSKPREPRLKHRLSRFPNPSDVAAASWKYPANCIDGLSFTMNKSVDICGVCLFGDKNFYTYKVSLELRSVNDICLAKASSQDYQPTAATGERTYIGYEVLFEKPVRVKAGVLYHIVALIAFTNKGEGSYHISSGGRIQVECAGVKFTFSDYPSSSMADRTTVSHGQIPEILFMY